MHIIVNNILKQNKSIQTRYDKQLSTFVGFIYLVCLNLAISHHVENMIRRTSL